MKAPRQTFTRINTLKTKAWGEMIPSACER